MMSGTSGFFTSGFVASPLSRRRRRRRRTSHFKTGHAGNHPRFFFFDDDEILSDSRVARRPPSKAALFEQARAAAAAATLAAAAPLCLSVCLSLSLSLTHTHDSLCVVWESAVAVLRPRRVGGDGTSFVRASSSWRRRRRRADSSRAATPRASRLSISTDAGAVPSSAHRCDVVSVCRRRRRVSSPSCHHHDDAVSATESPRNAGAEARSLPQRLVMRVRACSECRDPCVSS